MRSKCRIDTDRKKNVALVRSLVFTIEEMLKNGYLKILNLKFKKKSKNIEHLNPQILKLEQKTKLYVHKLLIIKVCGRSITLM